MSEVKRISIGYQPRPLQAYLHTLLAALRFLVVVCHRRFGKTRFVIGHILHSALTLDKYNPHYAYIAPTYGQAKRVAWEYFCDHVKNIPNAQTNSTELKITFPRPHKGDVVTIWLLGAENPDSIRGIYLDGAALDEYAQCDPSIWGQVIRPALSDRKGWAIFIGTPKGMNAFYDIYQQALKLKDNGWGAFVAKASKTGILDSEELEAMKLEMSDEEYEQEMECSFNAALVGAYYGKYLNDLQAKGQVTNVPYDPAALVDTYWDLGIGDSTAIWFVQRVGKEYHVIDYLESSGVGLEWYARKIKEKDYVYGEHWIPHDGAAKELGTGQTRQETLAGYGIRTKIAPKQAVDDGINAVRMLLPMCWFDTAKTERGFNALKNYERKWDGKNKIFLDTPLHNWASHGADAFRVFAMVTNPRYDKNKLRELPREADFNYNALR
jgi:hypothetical protein